MGDDDDDGVIGGDGGDDGDGLFSSLQSFYSTTL